ncbi:hypothetical protein KM043_013965 [Ampulex compressa]|nr:hypothetical protein KM043_013965 [Ampulex compressa]
MPQSLTPPQTSQFASWRRFTPQTKRVAEARTAGVHSRRLAIRFEESYRRVQPANSDSRVPVQFVTLQEEAPWPCGDMGRPLQPSRNPMTPESPYNFRHLRRESNPPFILVSPTPIPEIYIHNYRSGGP